MVFHFLKRGKCLYKSSVTIFYDGCLAVFPISVEVKGVFPTGIYNFRVIEHCQFLQPPLFKRMPAFIAECRDC